MFLAAATFAAAVLLMAFLYDGPWRGRGAEIGRGQVLYAKSCASCHGKNLEGQANWKTPLLNGRLPAPPHDATGHTWHHTDEALAGLIKFGLKPYVGPDYESDMPAFDGVLNDSEIADILTYIKSTWPERQRAYQEQVTHQ